MTFQYTMSITFLHGDESSFNILQETIILILFLFIKKIRH